ncbi:MAG: aminotransferase class IV [bacterium]
MKKLKVYLNGKIVPIAEAKISILDRGFFYGDGVFESLRTHQGQPFLLDEHLKRLLKAAKSIKLKKIPSFRSLKLAVIKTLRANKLKESYIKIIFTRGESQGHGLDAANTIGKPTMIILVEPVKDLTKKAYEVGLKAIISTIMRTDVPSTRIKSLCYLDAILAKMEAKKHGADEAFFIDKNGNLTEGTVSNVFIVKFDTIYTPPLTSPLLAGITRKLAIKLAKESAFRVIEKAVSPKELYTADECFITSSGAGIVPIAKVWNKKIGKGRRGYVTESLIGRYNSVTKKS